MKQTIGEFTSGWTVWANILTFLLGTSSKDNTDARRVSHNSCLPFFASRFSQL